MGMGVGPPLGVGPALPLAVGVVPTLGPAVGPGYRGA